jgi:hypothetical protein
MKTLQFKTQEEWLEARIAKITGSRLDIIVKSPFTKEDIINVLNEKGIDYKKTDTSFRFINNLKENLLKLLSPDDIRYLKRKAEKKIAFYELIAERLSIPEKDEKPIDRGHRLEEFALREFEKQTGNKLNIDLIMWVSDDDESIAVSPDAEVIDKPEAVEAKCLSSAKHIQAFLTQKVPDEYEEQAIQYFIVNEKLEKLHFAFYDDRLIVKQFFTITFTREQYADKIEEYKQYQIDILQEVNKIVAELSM